MTINGANRGGMEDNVMMASLGNVLSSVNISGGGGGDVDGGVGGGSYGAPGTAVGSNQTVPWGSSAPAPAG
jgi:hypothetical protein